MSDEYQFSIYVEPCLVSSYTATTIVSEIVYDMGEPSITDGVYAF